jgi:hypothetical protein
METEITRDNDATLSQRLPLAALGLAVFFLGACGSPGPPTIEFTQVPEATLGGAAKTVRIAGRANGNKLGQRIVLFAHDGTWWVQPFASKPYTEIRPDHSWANITHRGMEYAALLVEPGYAPPRVSDVLPTLGGPVVAVATVAGKHSALSDSIAPDKINFGGFEWEVYRVPKDSFGISYANSASNVWVDHKGWLHLRLTKEPEGWTGAEIRMTRSLGYGTYSFLVDRSSELEAATVFRIQFFDPLDAGQYHRAFDFMLGQFGDPTIKNGQYSMLPVNIPGNVYRFTVPHGTFMQSVRWERGRLSFQTQRTDRQSLIVAQHAFTSGVPTPGGEQIHISLFAYGNSKIAQRKGAEVIVQRFVYLP